MARRRDIDLCFYNGMPGSDHQEASDLALLKLDTAEEKPIFKIREQNYDAKKALSKINFWKQTPNDEEVDLIHAMLVKRLELKGMYPFLDR